MVTRKQLYEMALACLEFGHATGNYSILPDGTATGFRDRRAVAWCASGACRRVGLDSPTELYARVGGLSSVFQMNDRSPEVMRAMFREVIRGLP